MTNKNFFNFCNATAQLQMAGLIGRWCHKQSSVSKLRDQMTRFFVPHLANHYFEENFLNSMKKLPKVRQILMQPSSNGQIHCNFDQSGEIFISTEVVAPVWNVHSLKSPLIWIFISVEAHPLVGPGDNVINKFSYGEPPKLSGFVHATHPVVPSSNPKYTI